MSVEKIITHEEIPYFQIYTHVVQNISNMQAGFVWIYLLSKPKDWNVIKVHLKNKFKIGNDKLKKIFSYLKKHQLVDYIIHRDEKGRICKHETRILNGSKFLTDQQVEDLSTEYISTGSEIHPLDNQALGSGPLHIKEDTNKRKKQIKDSPIDIGRDGLDRFEEFYKLYPRKEGKRAAEKAWNKKRLNEIADFIITKVIERIKVDYSKRERKHIPLPATYLNGELWQDEIVSNSVEEKTSPNKKVQNITNEVHSTVPEWGPGHPAYDELHKFDIEHRELRNVKPQGSGTEKLFEEAIKKGRNKTVDNSLYTSVRQATEYLSSR